MNKVKPALNLIAACLIYSLIIMFATLIVIVIFTQELTQILVVLSYVSLAEGGLALTTGGVVATFSPTIGKLDESLRHSKPWDAKRQKEAEKQAMAWIVTGAILFLIGLFASAPLVSL